MIPRPIEIVGGGLAGLALGGALRRAGVTTTLLESGAYPRHRVCGEFISGLDEHTIERLDLARHLVDARRHLAVAWHLLDAPMRTHLLPSPAYGLSRYALDARLADEFVRLGGDLRTRTRVTDDTASPGRVFATGRRRGGSQWLGLKMHFHDLRLAADLEVHLGRESYVGLTTVEDGATNVCGLFRVRSGTRGENSALLIAYLQAAGLATLATRLGRATEEESSFCAIAGLSFDHHRGSAGRPELGDTFAMIPPFTGHGMAIALQSAECAIDPLVAYSRGEMEWPAACSEAHRRLCRRFGVRLATANALHGFLLTPRRQRWLHALDRAHLLPVRGLYHLLH